MENILTQQTRIFRIDTCMLNRCRLILLQNIVAFPLVALLLEETM